MRIATPLLINPKAGSLFRSGLKAWLDANRGAFRIIPTSDAGDLRDKARALAEAGEPVVAAAGGDGTLMCAAQGLVGTDTALGILPCGSMNVFAREMGIGSRRFDVALNAIENGIRREVDIFTVGGQPFLQMAGFGPDARIIQRITPGLKKHFGPAAHLITALKVAVESPPLITLTLPDGRTYTGTQVIMGNGRRYGGEALLFADAANDDGLLDAAVMHQESITVLFEVLGCMLQRGATQRNTSDFTELCSFETCTVSADGKLAYQLDGDYAGTLMPGETLTVARLPKRLRVCCPSNPVPASPVQRLMRHPLVEAWRSRLRRAGEF